jgi:hypothetical protein
MYVNALSDEGAAGVRRAYPPEKLRRLARSCAYYPHRGYPPAATARLPPAPYPGCPCRFRMVGCETDASSGCSAEGVSFALTLAESAPGP